jgi:hypothetical protein
MRRIAALHPEWRDQPLAEVLHERVMRHERALPMSAAAQISATIAMPNAKPTLPTARASRAWRLQGSLNGAILILVRSLDQSSVEMSTSKRQADIDRGEHQHDRLHARKSFLADALPAEIADAMQREHGFDDDRAARMKPSCTAADRQTGIAALRSACLKMMRARDSPWRARADVVRRHRLDHAGGVAL